jgi:hypothetical protein
MGKVKFGTFAFAAVGLIAGAMGANAATVVQFNFNSSPPDASGTTGSTSPSVGTAALAIIGGTTATFASGSARDAASTDNTAYNTTAYPAAAANSGTAGIQVSGINTTSLTDNLAITFDMRASATASKYYRFLYTIDGSSFTDGGLITLVNPTFFETESFVLTPAQATGSNFGFKVVSVFDPATGTAYAPAGTGTYGTSGTVRFDVISVDSPPVAVPEPIGLAALGLLGVMSLRRRQK